MFTPHQVSLESESGKTIDACNDPRSRFSANCKWDKLHAGYFSSYALWGYVTTPFLYTYAGFEAQEIAPWYENGERWRALQVSFLTNTRRTRARNTPTSAKTGFSDDISTPSMS